MKFNKFNPGKKITIFFIFFAITFFLLGLWQVERGHDKSKIIAEFNKPNIDIDKSKTTSPAKNKSKSKKISKK